MIALCHLFKFKTCNEPASWIVWKFNPLAGISYYKYEMLEKSITHTSLLRLIIFPKEEF